jgi:cytidine deaminase
VEVLPVAASDAELLEAAVNLLEERFAFQRHHVAAAIRGGSGAIYTGLHIGSRRVNVCAEAVAASTALAAGETELTAGIAVIKMEAGDTPRITSPCGICRELLFYYNPQMTVVVDHDGHALKTVISELLPAPWLLPAESAGIPTLELLDQQPQATRPPR